jgi:hypothetical protein
MYLKPDSPFSPLLVVCCILLVPYPTRTELILAFGVYNIVVESVLDCSRSNLCLEMVAIAPAVVVRCGEDTGGNHVTLVVLKHRRIRDIVVVVVVVVAVVDVTLRLRYCKSNTVSYIIIVLHF